jgi:hypothetical protein
VSVASAHLARIGAISRPTGSPGVAEARGYCADVLRTAGFAISEHSFAYSAFPASWAMPITGLVAVLATGTLFLGRSNPALTVGVLAVQVVALLVLAVLGRRGVLDYPLMRRRGTNLQAIRPGTPPTVWLVAHIDSKWQPVSMIARVAGVIGTSIGVVAMVIVSFSSNEELALVALVLTWSSALPLIMSVVGDRNHGTLDNASGVAAVLEAAQSIPTTARVGVLITDAEELALAGTRAWAKTMAPSVALNCDSLDDDGPLVVMYSRSRPDGLISRLESAALAVEARRPRVLRLIPGILTDSVALADAGWETLTLSRGTIRTLQRVHTSRDRLSAMRGVGIAGAARVLAQMATELG